VGWLRRLLGRGSNGQADGNGVISLPALRRGVEAEVVALDPSDVVRLQKVLALGILPGESVRLARRFPSFVVETGLTRFALDREVASAILVRPRR
jgi:DtxR family Mn-dependent transcriptional regulator